MMKRFRTHPQRGFPSFFRETQTRSQRKSSDIRSVSIISPGLNRLRIRDFTVGWLRTFKNPSGVFSTTAQPSAVACAPDAPKDTESTTHPAMIAAFIADAYRCVFLSSALGFRLYLTGGSPCN